MKKFCSIFACVIVIGACGSEKKSTTGWNYDDPQETAYYSMKIPDKVKMKDEKPRIIVQQKNKKYHILQFGKFNTETNWKIYDWFAYQTSLSELPKPLIDTHFKPGEESTINISSLSKGKYMIDFTAIAEGCSFELNIE